MSLSTRRAHSACSCSTDDIVTRKEAERRIEQAEERRRYQEQLDEAKKRSGMQ